MEANGLSSDLFVTHKTGTDLMVLSGTDPASQRWVHTLSRRAAHLLWYRLTWSLFPEKSPKVTGMAVTAALQPIDQPTLTIHIDLTRQTQTCTFDVEGRTADGGWTVTISDAEARRLWAALDLLLYPAGWEGAVTRTRRAD